MRMENRIKFGKWEAGALIINIICTKIFLYFNRMTVEDAGTAGWLMTLFTCAVVLLAFSLLIWMYKKFEGNDILISPEMAGGRIQDDYRVYPGRRSAADGSHHAAAVFRGHKDHISAYVPIELCYVFLYGRNGGRRFPRARVDRP